MKITAVIILGLAAVWLESFFMAGIGAPETIYFSSVLIVSLLFAGRPAPALAAALASGLAAELAAAQNGFGFLIITQTLAYAAARLALNATHAASKTMLAAIIVIGYGLFRQIAPWVFLLPGGPARPPLPLQSALTAGLSTCLFFMASLYATRGIRHLAKKWFL